MANPREIEIKLELDALDIAALKARTLPKLGAAAKVQHLVSVYFDTEDRALRKHGLTCRVRAVDGRHVMTVKTAAQSCGLHQRPEWERDIDGDVPEAHALNDTPAGAVLKQAAASLKPMFETVVERAIWSVESKRSTVEIALDEGHVQSGKRSRPIAELELELKQGRPADLFKLIRKLDGVAGLRTSVLAKSDHGYALLDRRKLRPSKAEPVELTRDATTGEAFQIIMRGCLRQFRLNEPLVVGARRPEALHQARVAMRRLRSALSLFKEVVGDRDLPNLKSKLRVISRELGEARNLDVYLERVGESEAMQAVGEAALAPFLAAIETRRAQAYDRIVESLAAPAFRRFMIDLLAWIEAGPWVTDADPLRRAARERPALQFAAELLDRDRRKLRKRGRRLAKISAADRHRARIAAKKLRYAADFFAALVKTHKQRERHAAFIQAMADLQAQLGDLNDIETAREIETIFLRHRAAGEESGRDAIFAAGHASGVDDARVESLLGAAVAAYHTFSKAKRFWASWAP